jgi:hypothetical protein
MGSDPSDTLPGVKKLFPIHDPNSTKYPDRIFYSGRWRTPEMIEAERRRLRERWANNPSFREWSYDWKRKYLQDPKKLEKKRASHRIKNMTPEQAARTRQSKNNSTRRRRATDPWAALGDVQRTREYRARKREEALRGS